MATVYQRNREGAASSYSNPFAPQGLEREVLGGHVNQAGSLWNQIDSVLTLHISVP